MVSGYFLLFLLYIKIEIKMFIVSLAGKWLFTWCCCDVFDGVLNFDVLFPRNDLDEIWD